MTEFADVIRKCDFSKTISQIEPNMTVFKFYMHYCTTNTVLYCNLYRKNKFCDAKKRYCIWKNGFLRFETDWPYRIFSNFAIFNLFCKRNNAQKVGGNRALQMHAVTTQ